MLSAGIARGVATTFCQDEHVAPGNYCTFRRTKRAYGHDDAPAPKAHGVRPTAHNNGMGAGCTTQWSQFARSVSACGFPLGDHIGHHQHHVLFALVATLVRVTRSLDNRLDFAVDVDAAGTNVGKVRELALLHHRDQLPVVAVLPRAGAGLDRDLTKSHSDALRTAIDLHVDGPALLACGDVDGADGSRAEEESAGSAGLHAIAAIARLSAMRRPLSWFNRRTIDECGIVGIPLLPELT